MTIDERLSEHDSILDLFGPCRMKACGNCGGELRRGADGRCLNCKKLTNSRYYAEGGGKQKKQARERGSCPHGPSGQRPEDDYGRCKLCRAQQNKDYMARLKALGLKRTRNDRRPLSDPRIKVVA